MTPSIAVIHDTRAVVPTVLGQRIARIPTSGKIRAGIKVLTHAAAALPQVQAVYDEGVRRGLSFDAIEETIRRLAPQLTAAPLVPKNVQWFTVHAGDFPNPVLAGQLIDKFGEDRGDGVRRLYRFPVVFPADSWAVVMPHDLVAWGASERKFWSQYDADGRVRRCMMYAPPVKEPGSKRVLRQFGGRKSVARSENGGVCDPECCPQFQARQCNLSGRFVFYIPGIASVDAFELPTNSFWRGSNEGNTS